MFRRMLWSISWLSVWSLVDAGAQQAPEITVDLPGGETMQMVWIPAGTFLMGAALGQPDTRFREHPQHEVTISRGFHFGRYEVTQEQWTAVMGTKPWFAEAECVQCPANGISWEDTQAFIHQLNLAAGDSLYRLPTEAEWEYAARAGTTTRWYFGDNPEDMCAHAWVWDNTCGAGRNGSVCNQPNEPCGPRAVGLKQPNPWGLYDLFGNVNEWVQDWWIRWYTETPQVDPVQLVISEEDRDPDTYDIGRMYRGDNYLRQVRDFRASARLAADSRDSPGNSRTGFRLVRQSMAPTSALPSSWGQIKANIN